MPAQQGANLLLASDQRQRSQVRAVELHHIEGMSDAPATFRRLLLPGSIDAMDALNVDST